MPSAFYSLKPLNLTHNALQKEIPLGPEKELKHGVLANGMTYYVRPNKKPVDRAALALVVRVGSVVEEEEERGCAHICEHLAFNGTQNYSNHDIVKFLESIGAEFGACQNAYTSADETVYELLLPIDKPELLQNALKVFAEFATRVVIADDDLDRERGAVLEEWRQGRTAAGRAAEAHWKLVLEGSRYAERLPIGLESVIRKAPASVVRGFYTKWYQPQNMAVVVVGDFPDSNAVVKLLGSTLGQVMPPEDAPTPPPAIPRFDFCKHVEPRFSTYSDAETTQSVVYVSFKHPRGDMRTPADYRKHLVAELFSIALNNRFFKISRRPNPPFYEAGTQSEEPARPVQSSLLNASCQEGTTLRALRALLEEVARVRLFGFSARELRIARAKMMADVETSYLERHQAYSTDIRDEYVRHFLLGEFVAEQEVEARLALTLLPTLTPQEVSAHAARFTANHSCVVKTMEHRCSVTPAALKQVVDDVAKAESERILINPWEEGDVPEELIPPVERPLAVKPCFTRRWDSLDVTELTFPNGLRVAYKCTDLLDDQVILSGFAAGGLSELPKGRRYDAASCAALLVNEIGIFGHKPEIIADILAGKRCQVSTSTQAYRRSFGGEQSPLDLSEALQLVHLLFTKKVVPVAEELKVIREMTLEAIRTQSREPSSVFRNRVRYVNYGGCYYFAPMTARQFKRVCADEACAFFNSSFHNPAEFTVVLVGALDTKTAIPLIEQYLGTLPEQAEPVPKKRSSLTPLPFSFPMRVVEEEVRVAMVEPNNATQITFPVQLTSDPRVGCFAEVHWVALATRLLESRLLNLLRFKFGEVYSVNVSAFFGAEGPANKQTLRGDVAIYFTCDPEAAQRLRGLALDELSRLQEEGPSAEDVATAVELETRAYEVAKQENSHWAECITNGYQSRFFDGDVDAAYTTSVRCRTEVMNAATPEAMRAVLRRIFPYPCRSRYTALTLLPQRPWYRRPVPLSLTVAVAVAAAAAVLHWRRR